MSFDCNGSLRVFHEADVIYSQPEVVVFDIALLKLRHPQALSAKQIETPVIASRLKQGIVFTQKLEPNAFHVTSMSAFLSTFSISLEAAVCSLGERCYVIGHALFGKEYHFPASITRGVVSSVLKHNKVPVLIQVRKY